MIAEQGFRYRYVYIATGRRFTLICLPADGREASPGAQLFLTCRVFDGAAAQRVFPFA